MPVAVPGLVRFSSASMVAALSLAVAGLKESLASPKSKNLRLPATGHEDVRGLDVTMDNALRMCPVESVCDLNAQIEEGFNLDWSAANQVPKSLAFHQLHGDEGPAIYLVNFVDDADVGVVQGRCRFGFPLEPAEGLGIAGQFFGKKLEGYVTSELKVFGFVDNPHAAAADLAQNAVMGKCLPERLQGSGHWRRW